MGHHPAWLCQVLLALGFVVEAWSDARMCLIGFEGWNDIDHVEVSFPGTDVESHSHEVGDRGFGGLHFSVRSGNIVKIVATGKHGSFEATTEITKDAGNPPSAGSLSLEGGPSVVFLVGDGHHAEAWTDFAEDFVVPLIQEGLDVDAVVRQMPDLWQKAKELHDGWFVTILGEGFPSQQDGKYGHLKLEYRRWTSDERKRTKRELKGDNTFGMWTVPAQQGTFSISHVMKGHSSQGDASILGPTFKRLHLGNSEGDIFLAVHGSREANEEFWHAVQASIDDNAPTYWGADRQWDSKNLFALWARLNAKVAQEQEPLVRDPVLHALHIVTDSTVPVPGQIEATAEDQVSDGSEGPAGSVIAVVVLGVIVCFIVYFCFCTGGNDGGEIMTSRGSQLTRSSPEGDIPPSVHGVSWPCETVRGFELEHAVGDEPTTEAVTPAETEDVLADGAPFDAAIAGPATPADNEQSNEQSSPTGDPVAEV